MNSKQPYREQMKYICQSYQEIGGINHLEGCHLPSQKSIIDLIKDLKELIFPGYFESTHINLKNIESLTTDMLKTVGNELEKLLLKSLEWEAEEKALKINKKNLKENVNQICSDFFSYVPELRLILKDDIQAIFDGDPAAQSEPEIILSYPGFQAITIHRISHFFHQKKIPLIPRMMSEVIHSETGIDIHPGAKIKKRFCIDHGTGIVIGETSEIGENVKLYQGVTIGALSVSKSFTSKKRHPSIKDNVTIYARTTILGGETIIGENCVIGGNLWITNSIPNNSTLYLTSDYKQVRKPNL